MDISILRQRLEGVYVRLRAVEFCGTVEECQNCVKHALAELDTLEPLLSQQPALSLTQPTSEGALTRESDAIRRMQPPQERIDTMEKTIRDHATEILSLRKDFRPIMQWVADVAEQVRGLLTRVTRAEDKAVILHGAKDERLAELRHDVDVLTGIADDVDKRIKDLETS